jgi:hypothetical protein
MSEQASNPVLRVAVNGQRRLRYLPALAALGLIGFSLYASQASVKPQAQRSRDAKLLQPMQAAAQVPAQTMKAVEAAVKFLETLDEKQRGKALLDFESPKRSGWSNLPITNVPRNGVRLGDLSKEQRGAAMAAVAAVLSKAGYQKVIDIMNADEVLATGKGGGKAGKGGKGPKDTFGNDNYFLAIFGKPAATTPWLLQFGGHHLGINVTVFGKEFILAPTHTGTQPALYTRDGMKVRPLGPENDVAFKLVNALDAKQQAQAVFKNKVTNLVLGPGQDGKRIEPQGIKGAEMTAAQQELLVELIAAWVNIVPDDAAASRLAEIKAKVGETYFGWSGPTTDGSAAYYRIQGPALVIEYAPQGGTDHIHTILRDPGNDYGQGVIKR